MTINIEKGKLCFYLELDDSFQNERRTMRDILLFNNQDELYHFHNSFIVEIELIRPDIYFKEILV